MLWEKEKLFVTSNFFFFQCFQKACTQQTHKNKGLFGGKGLKCFHFCMVSNFVKSFLYFKCTAECGEEGSRYRMLTCVWSNTGKLAPQGSCDMLERPRTTRKCTGPPCVDTDPTS